ncbi:putative pentatricopeptide repeat-containing protein At3g23330 [Phalaenopsis equestris]|uniref:putative pentatricopeptide repeat-containing protein At3g23330 n=1 Tax=Phalaenopsis equestris TaxID=78828 RepID=UPI0009E42AC7|nr:putative pentatricopeptide repeat-containing protein At3g23330 [Phalaenopsis equestris]
MYRCSVQLLLSSLSRLLGRSSRSEILHVCSALLAQLTRIGLLHMNLPSTAAAIVNHSSSVFPAAGDITPWNALIAELSSHGFPLLAIQAFSLMHRIALPLDSYSLCSALSAASSPQSKAVKLGNQIHAYFSKSGVMSNIFVGGALIDFYARTGAIPDAHQVFVQIPVRNAVCLNALLNGYVEEKLWMEGLSLFRSSYRLNPDGYTISAVLKICAEMSFILLGMQCHAYLIRRIMEKDVFLLSSLVEMYGKCGLVDKVHSVFKMFDKGIAEGRRDVVLWTSLLNAYGRNGLFDDVISTFEEMLVEGTEPDEIVMLVILSACARSGNVMKGIHYLESMTKEYKMVPRHEHYSCVVDLLCRAGEVEKALNFVTEIAAEDNGDGGTMFAVSAWGVILSACSDYGNVKIAKLAFHRAIQLDQDNVGVHVELSNLYARVGMWDELAKLRKLMLDKGMKKDMGHSRLEIMN